MPAPAIIAKGILTASSLATKIGEMPIPDTNSPAGITDKSRWFTMTIINQTQWEIQYMKSYFDSGRFFTAPTNVEPFKDMEFSGSDKDGSIFTGVSGGAAFRIRILTTNGDYEAVDFAVGFSNPYFGSLKTSVVLSDDPEKAYDKIEEGTSSNKSNAFEGQNEDGDLVKVQFDIIAESGQHMTCTVTETLLNE